MAKIFFGLFGLYVLYWRITVPLTIIILVSSWVDNQTHNYNKDIMHTVKVVEIVSQPYSQKGVVFKIKNDTDAIIKRNDITVVCQTAATFDGSFQPVRGGVLRGYAAFVVDIRNTSSTALDPHKTLVLVGKPFHPMIFPSAITLGNCLVVSDPAATPEALTEYGADTKHLYDGLPIDDQLSSDETWSKNISVKPRDILIYQH